MGFDAERAPGAPRVGPTAVHRLRHWSQRLLDIVLPPSCAHCGQTGQLICDACLDDIAWVRPPLCARCGRPSTVTTLRCATCRDERLPLRQIRAAVHFAGPVPRIIHRFKYNGARALAAPIAGWMVAAWADWPTAVDRIVPIPLHRERARQRGYNQAALLAAHLAPALNAPVAADALRREQHTSPQANLTAAERRDNVRGAFTAGETAVAGRDILLVDDVYTTGATLNAAAEALLAAGARGVAALCAAQAAD